MFRRMMKSCMSHPTESIQHWASYSYLITSENFGKKFNLHVMTLTKHLFCLLQYNTNAFHKPFWEWTSCARPNPVWERRQFSSWRRFSSWNQPTITSTSWSCVILASSLFRSARSTSDSLSICRASRLQSFSVECRSRRTKKRWRRWHRISSSAHLVAFSLSFATRSLIWRTWNISSLMSATRCWSNWVSFDTVVCQSEMLFIMMIPIDRDIW